MCLRRCYAPSNLGKRGFAVNGLWCSGRGALKTACDQSCAIDASSRGSERHNTKSSSHDPRLPPLVQQRNARDRLWPMRSIANNHLTTQLCYCGTRFLRRSLEVTSDVAVKLGRGVCASCRCSGLASRVCAWGGATRDQSLLHDGIDRRSCHRNRSGFVEEHCAGQSEG